MKMSLYSSFKKFVSTLEMIFYFKKHLSSARAKFSGAPASQEKKKKNGGLATFIILPLQGQPEAWGSNRSWVLYEWALKVHAQYWRAPFVLTVILFTKWLIEYLRFIVHAIFGVHRWADLARFS